MIAPDLKGLVSDYNEGIYKHAVQSWHLWMDRLHEDKLAEQKQFMHLWYQFPTEERNEDYLAWKSLVQRAYLEGYEAGFTDRIFKGDLK